MNKGKLYLIPTILSDDSQEAVLPSIINNHIKEINVFIVENLRTSRRHIKNIYPEKDIDSTTFYAYGKHDTLNLEQDFLPHILCMSTTINSTCLFRFNKNNDAKIIGEI